MALQGSLQKIGHLLALRLTTGLANGVLYVKKSVGPFRELRPLAAVYRALYTRAERILSRIT